LEVDGIHLIGVNVDIVVILADKIYQFGESVVKIGIADGKIAEE
jgi:hypothetical protein